MRAVPILVLAGLAFALSIGSAWWMENRGWYDPLTGQRTCDTAPPAVKVFSSMYGTRQATDLANLDRWLSGNPDKLNRQYGPSCTTPLHMASRSGREDAVALLIARGADLGAHDKYGDTPLHTAAGYARFEIVALLLEHGADVNARGQDGQTPLHDAVFGLAGTTDIEARLQVTRALLDAGADVNAQERGSGFTPLHYAAGPSLSGNERMVELLIAYGTDPGRRDAQGTPLLVQAAAAGDRVGVQRLLDAGADVNAADRDTTALGAAASGGHLAVATLLVQRNADVNRRVSGSRLPWQGLPLAMALVVAPSNEPAMSRRRDVAVMLLASGSDVDPRDAGGDTLLARAAGAGDRQAVELLAARGANVSARGSAGRTPLHWASDNGRFDVAAFLLAAGADPEARDSRGTTPIDLAAGDPQMEALLAR